MKEATLIYPHQLFKKSSALTKERPVFLIEESLFLTYNPIHRQKLQLHKLSMDAYQQKLQSQGYKVFRISIHDYKDSSSVFLYLQSKGIDTIHVLDTTDNFLEKAIAESGLKRVWYESPLFILPKEESVERYINSKKQMAAFYKQLRKDTNMLMDGDTPLGGKWSFDEDNRKKIPRNTTLPSDITKFETDEIQQAAIWAESIETEKYGESGCWLPYTHEGAESYLHAFLIERFENFGTYEDAMTTKGVRLWHSTIAPLLNIGLLTPQEILEAAVDYADKHAVSINSLEGFVRQILGWREFIRASYEADGSVMRTKNFWNHTRSLPSTFWTGNTGVFPVDKTIFDALTYGYTHHIERLMVLGNFMLLTKTKPDDVYRWFMGMYIDAYDWVMVPNVYGMSQFADGGSLATKPYISGSNYIKKMSDYSSGDWEELWTALYWNFIAEHKAFFESNHRLSMMPRLLEKMTPEKRTEHLMTASEYLSSS